LRCDCSAKGAPARPGPNPTTLAAADPGKVKVGKSGVILGLGYHATMIHATPLPSVIGFHHSVRDPSPPRFLLHRALLI